MHLTDATCMLDGRRQAVDQHQAELEAELESRNPVLYRKVMGLRPIALKSLPPVVTSSHTAKDPRADLVEPLSRGLRKMQGQSYKTISHAYDKLGEPVDASAASGSEDFDEIDPREEQFQDDPAFLKAGDLGGMGRGRGSSNLELRRGRERSFWKRLRTNK